MSGLRLLACLVISWLAIALPATAAERVVLEEKKKFSEKKLALKAGDKVTFVNKDQFAHNVYSKSKGHEFDLGAQGPDTSDSVTFSKPGKIKVRCAIHPKMKLTITVK